MNAWNIAWCLEGKTAFKDVHNAVILASTIDEAKKKWLETKPECKILDALCKNLTDINTSDTQTTNRNR